MAINKSNLKQEVLTYLKDNNIRYVTNNYGVHIILDVNGQRIDYWPGTQLCIHKETRLKGFNQFKEYIEQLKPEE